MVNNMFKAADCEKCGAPLEQKDTTTYKCKGCGTIYILDKDYSGDDFWYEKIQVGLIEKCKITGFIKKELPINQIIEKKIIITEDIDLKLSKESLVLSKNESINVVKAYINQEENYFRALETINSALALNENIGELVFYKILCEKKIKSLNQIFNKDFSIIDQENLLRAFSTSNPYFVKSKIEILLSNIMRTDASELNLLSAILPFVKSKQVYDYKERELIIDKIFNLIIYEEYFDSFDYLLQVLEKNDLEKYIKYNLIFAKNIKNPYKRKDYFKRVLEIENGNLDALFLNLVTDFEIKDLPFDAIEYDCEELLKYSIDSDSEILKIIDRLMKCNIITYNMSLLFKKLLGCYSKGYEVLKEKILSFAQKILESAYKNNDYNLFVESKKYLYICLALDKNNIEIYKLLLYQDIKVYDDETAIKSRNLLENSIFYNKCIALTENDKMKQKKFFDISKKQKKRINIKREIIKYSIITACISLIVLTTILISTIATVNYQKKTRGTANFIVNVLKKENDVEDSVYFDGLVVGFYFTIKNNSPYDVEDLSIDYIVEIKETNFKWSYSVEFYPSKTLFTKGSTLKFITNIDERTSNEMISLYYSTFEKLQVQCRITEIEFADGVSKVYDEEFAIIKRFGSSGNEDIDKEIENSYQKAISLYESGKYEEALAIFKTISSYKESQEYIKKCEDVIKEKKYQEAISLYESGKYEEALAIFKTISSYKESQEYIKKCEDGIKEEKYQEAISLYELGEYEEALAIFKTISSYKESQEYIIKIYEYFEIQAINLAKEGKYEEAMNILRKNDNANTDLYKACENAENGIYYDIVNLLGLSKVIVSSNATEINMSTFENCLNIKEVIIPESVKTIKERSFYKFEKLEKVTIPETIEKIEDKAFYGCTSLKEFNVPDGINDLGDYVLSKCTSLEKISISLLNGYSVSSLFSFGRGSIDNSPNFPISLTTIDIKSGTVIPTEFFYGLPETITNINYAEEIVEIGDSAFMGSSIAINVPSTVKVIEDCAYSSIGILMDSVLIPEGVEKLGDLVFCRTYFKEIYLPSTLTSIGHGVFADNTKLKKIYFNETKNTWLSIVDSTWDYSFTGSYEVICTDAIYTHTLYGGTWEYI